MNNLLLLCLQIMLFALISPISGQYETEVNQNNGDDYQNNGADYQNNGYIGDGDNDYENNGDYNQNNGDDYQNNGADYQNNNNQNNGLDDQNDASNPLDSEELQHLKDMRQEMAGLNRRLKPPSLQNTHSEFKPQSLDLGGDNGEQTFITLGPEKSTTTDTTTTTTEIETTPTTVTDLPTTPTTVTDLPTTPTTVTDLPTTPTITTGIVSEPPTPPPGGNETCRDWLPWGECQQSADGSKCEKERTCVGGPPGSNNETQDCPEFKPPSCKEEPQCNDWGEWGPCKEVNVGPTLSESGCHRERICKDDQNIKMKENCPGGVTAPLCGNEPCERWFPWTECKPSPDSSKCERTRACDKGRFGGGHLDYNETEDCSGAPPQCEDTPPTPTDQPPTPTPPPEECKEWTEWSPCKHMGGTPGKCRREKICRAPVDLPGPVEDCPNVEPPMCGNSPPTGNCTEYDYKDCGPTCIRCGCCIDPPGFVGVGEYGCEPCTGGICEPLV